MPTPHLNICALAASSLLCSAVYAGGVSEDHGLADLISRLGAGNEPTGAGVEVAQVEGSEEHHETTIVSLVSNTINSGVPTPLYGDAFNIPDTSFPVPAGKQVIICMYEFGDETAAVLAGETFDIEIEIFYAHTSE